VARKLTVDKLASVKKLASVTLIAVAIVLAAVAPSQGWGGARHGSRGHPGGSGGTFHRGSGGGHPGAFHDGFRGGNLRDGVLGHRSFNRGHFNRGRFFVGGGPLIYSGYPYYGYYAPAYGAGYSAPAYWYYCPSYGAYYPNVASCPEAWIPVPAW
jgi:hypothetical protein